MLAIRKQRTVPLKDVVKRLSLVRQLDGFKAKRTGLSVLTGLHNPRKTGPCDQGRVKATRASDRDSSVILGWPPAAMTTNCLPEEERYVMGVA